MKRLWNYFWRKKAVPEDPDPLIGNFFLATRVCANCRTVQNDRKGYLIKRFPGVFAYVSQPLGFGLECRNYRFQFVVNGFDMAAGWFLYPGDDAGRANMLRDEREMMESSIEHRHHEHVN